MAAAGGNTSDSSSLLGEQTRPKNRYTPGSVPDYGPIYQDQSQSPTNKLLQLAFVAVVMVMVLISFILSIYRGATADAHNSGLYVLLGLSLFGFVALEIMMIIFVRKGDLAQEKSWFLYFVGAGIILESIFTNILLFQ